MSLFQTYDDALQRVLTDYGNASPDHQVVVGDPVYMRAVGLASALWGLDREADWVLRQIFPDTADADQVAHFAGQLGLVQQSAEDAGSLLSRVLARLRTPAAGGNATDYEQWAAAVPKGSEAVSSIKAFTAGYGPGTVVIVVSKADGTPISPELAQSIKLDALQRGPVAPANVYVLSPSVIDLDVSVTMVGGDSSLARSLIADYMATLGPGQAVSPFAFRGFAFQAGATQVTVVAPGSDALISPPKWGVVVLGTLLVNGS